MMMTIQTYATKRRQFGAYGVDHLEDRDREFFHLGTRPAATRAAINDGRARKLAIAPDAWPETSSPGWSPQGCRGEHARRFAAQQRGICG